MPIVSGFVVGFVNRQSRGVLKVQRELRENENGEAVYDFGYQTAVLVCEKKSPRGERLKEEAIMNGWLKENAQKPSEMTEKDVMDNQKPSNVMENESKTVTETEKPSFPYIFFTEITHFCDSIKCRLSVGLLLALPNGHTPCIEAKEVRRQSSLLWSVA